jgi:hypothetical protein
MKLVAQFVGVIAFVVLFCAGIGAIVRAIF